MTATMLTAFAVALIPAACGGGSGDGTTAAGPAGTTAAGVDTTASGAAVGGQTSSSADAVTIKDFAYSPPDLTVSSGTTVSFTNQDTTPHTATATGRGFDTGSIGEGKSATVKLEDPATFTYVCTFHPFMHGTITVK